MVSCMDAAVGRITKALDEHKFPPENTLVIFCSDNGGIPRLGSNGKLRAGKGTLYEGGVRVPAVMVWKNKLPAGGSVNVPLHMVDILPTLANLAGAKLTRKKPLNGHNVWPTITEGKPRPDQTIVYNVTPFYAAVRVGDWKIIHNGHIGANATTGSKQEKWELFNLKTDPYEKKDLSKNSLPLFNQLKRVVASLRQQMVKPNIPPNRAPAEFLVPKIWGEFPTK